MRLRGYWEAGRRRPGVATEQSVLAWQLYYVDVCLYILPKQTTQSLTLQ